MSRFLELVRYGIVGIFNAGTYLGLYSLLVLLGVPFVLSAIVAFPLPVALGYWLHEHWTFARKDPTARRLGAFLGLQALSLGGSLLLLIALVNGLHVDPILARVITTPISPLLVYLGSRTFIFSAPPATPPAPAGEPLPGRGAR
jgi:putative flippase GtrA